MKRILLCVLVFVIVPPAICTAQQPFLPSQNDIEACMTVGCYYVLMPLFFTRLNYTVTDGGNNFALDCPYIHANLLGDLDDVFQIEFGGTITWGLTHFYVDLIFSLGAAIFPFMDAFDPPFGRILNLHLRGLVGSFFLNNVTLRAEGGIDIELMIIAETMGFYFAADAFIQGKWPVLNYIPDGAWFENSMGFALRCGLTLRWKE